MDFRMSEEQELLLRSLDELLSRECPESKIAEWDNHHQEPLEAYKRIAQAGIGALGIPEEYGGIPVDTVTLCLVQEEMGRHGIPALPFDENYMAMQNIIDFGSAKQKAELLPGLMRGDVFVALGISESGAGSDTAAIKTRYTRVGGGYLINGEKTYTTGAHHASHIMLVTRDPDVPDPHKAMTMFLVPTHTPGVEVYDLSKVGTWTSGTSMTYYNDVFVPDDVLFGIEHNGFFQLVKNFERERLIICAGALGQAEAAFEDACRYANKREQFGQPIGRFQLIQERIAYMAIKIENMRNMTYKCAWMLDQGLPIRAESAMAKLYCARSCFEVCDDAMQIFGGVGYMMDNRIQRLWRDARMQRLGGGTDEIMTYALAPQILKRYREQVPDNA